ncbi:MAG: sensor histidine kinase [Streptosporangiaceae bacterium]
MRRRKLSLRGRMLVMLVAVTIILLLIMGTVSGYLVTNRANAQAASRDATLNGAATLLARDPLLAANQSQTGYAAVEVPLASPSNVESLTRNALTSQLAAAVGQWLRSPAVAPAVTLAKQGRRRQAVQQLETLDCQQLPRAGCKPDQLAPGMAVVSRFTDPASAAEATSAGRAILFVGEDVSTSTSQVRDFVIAELITGLALIVLLALGGEWLIGRGLDPLDEMTRTASEITSRGDLTARMPDDGDRTEIGRLGASINTMLDRIQQAFTSRLRSEQKVREFAADASHELRTPLTTIRGYAELYRQGALGPDQLPNAMRRIEQESERMSMLVAELLELARLDRTSSLDLAETDLASLVRDAVSDAIAVEPGRPVRADAPPRLVAVVDEARIRQVLANLLANVREHTPAGTRAVVRLAEAGGGVLIEVADAGPGMSPQNAARAFDRFHRAGPSAAEPATAETDHHQEGNGADRATVPYRVAVGPQLGGGGPGPQLAAAGSGPQLAAAAPYGSARDGAEPGGREPSGGPGGREPSGGPGGSEAAGAEPGSTGPDGAERTSGSGLGLSIVQAIAAAHGGRAALDSVPGSGTRARVWLPVRVVS